MKKNLLIIALGAFMCSYAQKVWITGTMPVKVEERTLFYAGNGYEVKDNTAVVTNQGNIQIAGGDFIVNNNSTFDNFFLDWQTKGIDVNGDGINDDAGYGQLIVEDAYTSTGKVAIEKKMPSETDIENVQIAYPFSASDTPSQIISYSTNSDIYFSNNSNRLYHPLYKWNTQLMRWDRKNKDGGVNAWEYYIVRNVGGMQSYNNASVRMHLGVPYNTTHSETLYSHANLPDLRYTNAVNAYNEVYKSYIDDNFYPLSNPNWGKYQYQYGNPYTSNIDLSYIGFDEEAAGAFYDENGNGTLDTGEALNDGNNVAGLVGVYKVVSGNEVNPVYNFTPNNFTEIIATANNGKFTAGDADVLLVKPMEAFGIKTDGSNTTQTFNFEDGLKTFSYSPKVVSNASGDGEVEFRTGNANDFGTNFYQLRMSLITDSQYINRTYVVAQSELSNGIDGHLESMNSDEFSKGLYTQEELAEGEGVDPNHTLNKLYINQVNTSYLGIPIPVYAEALTTGETYTIDFDLCNGIIDLPQDQLSYNNPNAKYYFHDIFTDEYFEIFNNSSYTFTKSSQDGSDTGERFELFFGGLADNMGIEDIDSSLSSTKVYTDGGNNYIRFDKTWERANISVYTAVGQIVFMKNDVATDNDFELPLNNANVTTFIVKVENPATGESISKKVVN